MNSWPTVCGVPQADSARNKKMGRMVYPFELPGVGDLTFRAHTDEASGHRTCRIKQPSAGYGTSTKQDSGIELSGVR